MENIKKALEDLEEAIECNQAVKKITVTIKSTKIYAELKQS